MTKWIGSDGKFRTTHAKGLLPHESAGYGVWSAMRRRCYSPGDKDYPRYGGRGIGICERWRTLPSGFPNFTEDMGPRPSPLHTLDRINNDGNYEPGNCRWATHSEQNNNKRNNVIIEINGERLNISQWAKKTGVSKGTIHARLERGVPPADAISKEKDKRGSGEAIHEAFCEKLTLKQWSEKTGLTLPTIQSRLSRGWTFEDAVSKKLDTQGQGKNRKYTTNGETMSLTGWAEKLNMKLPTLCSRIRNARKNGLDQDAAVRLVIDKATAGKKQLLNSDS